MRILLTSFPAYGHVEIDAMPSAADALTTLTTPPLTQGSAQR